MRSLLVGLPLLAAAAVLQSTVLPAFRVLAGGGPDLVLVLALSWTLAGGWESGVSWGFFGGLCLDLLSGGPLGAAALAGVLMTALASLTEGQFWRSHVLLPLAVSLLGSVGFHLVQFALLAGAGVALDWGQALAGILLPSTLLNTLCVLPVYQLMRGLHGLVFPLAVKR
ncbi:MAG: rod shape-determining protein MreD [Anaerolineales bacterium]|nr:rod shape-determining protein MreD [Anaerolineales bacterium]